MSFNYVPKIEAGETFSLRETVSVTFLIKEKRLNNSHILAVGDKLLVIGKLKRFLHMIKAFLNAA